MDDLSHTQQLPANIYQIPGTSKTQQAQHVTFALPTCPPPKEIAQSNPGPIRRRRFSAAKIQPTRIKKVMQSDEEIGRMVASVPVAIGRAMEHFAEKFLLTAASVTQNSNCRTLTPSHMKLAIANNPHFHFLENIFRDVSTTNIRPNELSSSGKPLEDAYKYFPGCSPINTPTSQNSTNDSASSPMTTSPLVSSPMTSGVRQISLSRPPEPGMTIDMTTLVPDVGMDRPRRGRPRKKKEDKCLDDELCQEVTNKIEKEEKDRALMPPPSLPVGMLARNRSKQTA